MSTMLTREDLTWEPPAARLRPIACRRWTELLIRALDVIVALSVIVLLGWLFLLIGLAVRATSPGPGIFRQRRVGRDGRVFTVYKFRTMRRDADEKVHATYIRAFVGTGVCHNGDGRLYKLIDDRITRVGRFLRGTSLDELPQLWNVMRGDMSLVGPRPVVIYEVDLYPDWYRERFRVKPGLTGLWQVSGRGRLTYEEMVTLDLDYVARRSLWLNLTILARTAPALLFRRETA